MEAGQEIRQRKQLQFHTSRLRYALLYTCAAILFGLAVFFLAAGRGTAAPLILLAAGAALVAALETMIHIHRLTLEDSQMVYTVGLLSRKSTTTHYSAIVDIIATQTFLQRIFGHGDIRVKTTAATEIKEIHLESFPKLRAIEAFIKDKVHLHRSGKK